MFELKFSHNSYATYMKLYVVKLVALRSTENKKTGVIRNLNFFCDSGADSVCTHSGLGDGVGVMSQSAQGAALVGSTRDRM